MSYQSLFTNYGMQRLAEASAAGVPINLTQMAVGDGNGNPTAPSELQTHLVRERYRAAINRVYQDAADPQQFVAELVIPAATGGFTLREIGVFDVDGSLLVVGNLPDVYKPTADEGAFADTVVRVVFRVDNADNITLVIDPNTAVASQTWVLNSVTAATVIPGGNVGQFLGKKSNADGDVEWQELTDITVNVRTLGERQTLAAGQTTVTLALTTTDGLAVYVNGIRIDKGSGTGEWSPDETDDTVLHLGQAYPAGTRLSLYQNEPTGSAAVPLERNRNLADVPDKAQARTNLGIYSKEEVDQRCRQPGDIFYTAANTAPARSLKANGATVSRIAYAKLFAAIGTRFGAGDGSSTFNLPDLRGEFVRGWDDGRGVDGGRELGSYQGGSLQLHGHSGSAATAGKHGHSGKTTVNGTHSHTMTFLRDRSPVDPGNAVMGDENYYGEQTHTTSKDGAHIHGLSIDQGGEHSHTITIGNTGGSETRPRNIALLACIAF